MSQQLFAEDRQLTCLPDYPSERPSYSQMEKWLEAAGTVLRRIGFHSAMVGICPPSLQTVSMAAEMPDVGELTAAQRAEAGPISTARHDYMRAKASQDRLAAERHLNAGLLEYHNRFAALLEASLRKNAPLRLKALLSKHAVAGMKGAANGGAMWRELEGTLHLSKMLEDSRDHDRAIEVMRDNYLPDGCSVQEFSNKINLAEHHFKYMERPFTPKKGFMSLFRGKRHGNVASPPPRLASHWGGRPPSTDRLTEFRSTLLIRIDSLALVAHAMRRGRLSARQG